MFLLIRASIELLALIIPAKTLPMLDDAPNLDVFPAQGTLGGSRRVVLKVGYGLSNAVIGLLGGPKRQTYY